MTTRGVARKRDGGQSLTQSLWRASEEVIMLGLPEFFQLRCLVVHLVINLLLDMVRRKWDMHLPPRLPMSAHTILLWESQPHVVAEVEGVIDHVFCNHLLVHNYGSQIPF